MGRISVTSLQPGGQPPVSSTNRAAKTRTYAAHGELVPTDEPFAPGPERVLSRVVTRFTLAYRDEDGAWRDKWDGREEDALPTAVRVELAVAGLPQAPPALVVALPTGKQQVPQ